MLLLLGALAPAYASVHATLSSSTTSLDESVNLSIQIKGENTASPDLSVIEKDFEILGRSQQQSISVINGKASKTRGLTLTLLPKQLGRIEIPPITVGDESSASLALEVVQALPGGDAKAASSAGAFIELELNKSAAYLQEEVILTVRLYEEQGVEGESLTEPEPSLPETSVVLLKEERYPAEREGQSYQVVTRRYAVYAYRTGQLQLGGVRFRGHTGSARQPFYDLLREPFGNPSPQERRIVRARSDTVTLDIKPIPANFTGKRWLPARNLQIVENGLSGSGPKIAGRPVSRQIMVFADGLTSVQLPPIELELPTGMKQYPERPQVKDNVSRSGISGSRRTGVTLVATDPGSFELPPIEIPWWNTETDREEIARLPAVRLEIQPGLVGTPAQQAPVPQSPYAWSAVAQQPPQTTVGQSAPRLQGESSLPGWLIWLLGIGWLAALLSWWWSHRNQPEPEKAELHDDSTNGGGRTKQDARAEGIDETATPDALTVIIDELDVAYRTRNAEAARQAWLRWGQQRWPDNPPSNLNRLAQRCPSKIAQAVALLDRAFYSPANPDDWSGLSPRELLERRLPMRQQPIVKEKLAPINPKCHILE